MSIIEIIGSTVEDCIEIEKGGAQRIELVSALEVGGLTPSYGLIRKAKQAVQLPINVMIRPHSLSFQYSKQDLEAMLQDIDICKQLQVSGIVLGVLNSDKKINTDILNTFIKRADDLDITFHKAFDETHNLLQSLHTLSSFKQVNRVLTQGGTLPILQNKQIIKELVSKTNKIILLGGGLKHTNFQQIVSLFPTCEYHFGTAVREHGRVRAQLIQQIVAIIK